MQRGQNIFPGLLEDDRISYIYSSVSGGRDLDICTASFSGQKPHRHRRRLLGLFGIGNSVV